MPTNQLFTDWVAGQKLTAAKLNQMKNDLAALASANFTILLVAGNGVWHAGNDGAGSGLDADTVDGVQAAVLMHSLVQTFAVNRTLSLSADQGGYLVFTAEATVTLPAGAPNGWACRVRHAAGSAAVRLLPASGVTLVGRQEVESGGVAWLVANGSDVWYADGFMQAVTVSVPVGELEVVGLVPVVAVTVSVPVGELEVVGLVPVVAVT